MIYKSKYKIAKNKRRQYRHKFVQRIKLKFGCLLCGYNKSAFALHFDHLRDKIIEISHMVRRNASMLKIKNEIRKCRILCANCHMEETFKRKI